MSLAVAGRKGPDIPGFRWVRPLGQGGFADVFLYHQDLPSRDVAIKIVRDFGDARGTKELHREADAMTLLAGHPSVVELHGVGTTSDGREYLIMEYCPVADLLTEVRARPMSLENALDTMVKICGVVEMFHRNGYVHRDIKPSNIMLDAYGKPVLADFGVASKVGSLEVGAFDGFSVLWAPPEQQDARTPASPLQDVWALAATTWTFITGRSPFEDPIGDNSAASVATRVQLGRIRGLGRADAPVELERILRAAMTVNPTERTQSAQAFGEALQGVQRSLGLDVTAMEVKDKRSTQRTSAPAADQKTRLRGAPVIDPEATRLRQDSYAFEGTYGSGGIEAVADSWKIQRADDGEDAGDRAGSTQRTREPMSRWAILLLTAVAVLIAVGMIVGMLRGQGSYTRITPDESPTASASAPRDALARPPAPITDLAGTYEDGHITWTWNAPDAMATSGVSYNYVTSGNTDEMSGTTQETALTLPVQSGQNCIEITVSVSGSGRQSDPVHTCVSVP